jgi:hypothetical protein
VKQKAVLMRVPKDRLVDAVTPLFLAVGDLKSKRRLGNAIILPDKAPALVMKESRTVGDQKLQVTDLR